MVNEPYKKYLGTRGILFIWLVCPYTKHLCARRILLYGSFVHIQSI